MKTELNNPNQSYLHPAVEIHEIVLEGAVLNTSGGDFTEGGSPLSTPTDFSDRTIK